MQTDDLASVAVGVLAAVVTGTATGVGEQAGAAVVQVVRERLGTSQRGRLALAGLDADGTDAAARREAEEVLREEVAADPRLGHTLTYHLNAPTTQATGSVLITGSQVSRAQISVGPMTVNKPSTPGGIMAWAVTGLALAALLSYGGVRVFTTDDSPDGGGGSGPVARALSVAETKEVVPAEGDLPTGWAPEGERGAGTGDLGKCHQGGGSYDSMEVRGLDAEFRVRACPNARVAAQVYKAALDWGPNGRPTTISMPRFGEESRAVIYTDPDMDEDNVIVKARVGTVIIDLRYGPVDDQPDYATKAAELMRSASDLARRVQARG
ncbi:hypothetical protein RB200_23635 [Streptomyces sp. PmtG]